MYLLSFLNKWPSLHILENFIEIISLAKLFNFSLSFQGGATDVFAFIATVHYLIGRRMTCLLSPVTSLTALISDSSRDTRSFATNIPNIVPRWINFFTLSLSLACRVLIAAAAAHSPWVVVLSANSTSKATAPPTSTAQQQWHSNTATRQQEAMFCLKIQTLLKSEHSYTHYINTDNSCSLTA